MYIIALPDTYNEVQFPWFYFRFAARRVPLRLPSACRFYDPNDNAPTQAAEPPCASLFLSFLDPFNLCLSWAHSRDHTALQCVPHLSYRDQG